MQLRHALSHTAFWFFTASGFAQPINPPPTAEPAPAAGAVAGPLPGASAPALLPLEPVTASSDQSRSAQGAANKPTADPPPLEGCRPLTERAMTSDLKAATAQSNRRDLAEQVAFLEEAIDWWTRAALQCDGRAKERAQRNIADNQKAREKLSEQLQSGPQCEAAQKGATTLQDLARQTLSERRFLEAAALFRKSEDAWDNASELCTGTQHALSIQRRDQSATDGHNAEFCAPVFERAREQTQKLRGLAPTAAREERQDVSQQAETAWREAMTLCKGGVIEAARNQAQAIARERGTPWIVKPLPTLPAVAAAPAPTALRAAETTASKPSNVPVPVSAGAAPAPMKASITASSVVESTKNPPMVQVQRTEAPAPTDSGAMPSEFTAGSARFVGKFTRDTNSPTYTGTGRITWGNGDVFEGTFVKGKRQGKGLFIWANGQRHDGEWLDDVPTGQAKVVYANGNRYEGMVRDGLPQGSGRMQYASGDTYHGEFDNGTPEGKGLYTWKSGQTFEGQWKADSPNGQGKLHFANGNLFTGTVVNGVPNGPGQMVFVTGETYTGTMVQGQPEGKGMMVWANGDQYVGEWKAGKKHGAGIFTWKTGERWEGTHDNDVRQ